jgi:methylated-DNA-[protein]-cysteine S-methyltransferase
MARIEGATVESPIGRLGVFARDGVVVLLEFEGRDLDPRAALRRRFPDAVFADVRQPGFVEPLLRYFDGDLHALDAMTCDPGGTPFQSRVWTALRTIPVGRTWSYGELARRLGDPKAVRAVGFANGSNPIAVAVPCHRVIGSDGTLVGYGGGLERKRWLLAHEGALPAEQAALFP